MYLIAFIAEFVAKMGQPEHDRVFHLLQIVCLYISVFYRWDSCDFVKLVLFGQRLSYSAEEPLADAAKLYWHFFRTEQSGTAGIIITLFLYGVHCILSFTFLYVYFLRYRILKAI